MQEASVRVASGCGYHRLLDVPLPQMPGTPLQIHMHYNRLSSRLFQDVFVENNPRVPLLMSQQLQSKHFNDASMINQTLSSAADRTSRDRR